MTLNFSYFFLLCIHYLGFLSLHQTINLIRVIKLVIPHRYSQHLLWCFSSSPLVKTLAQEMIICPNSYQESILPIYKWVNTLIITNWPNFVALSVLLQLSAQSHYPCHVAPNPVLLKYFHQGTFPSIEHCPAGIFTLRLFGFLYYWLFALWPSFLCQMKTFWFLEKPW